MGEIRYQWWRDAIDAIYEDRMAEPHPVLIKLEPVIQSSDLPKHAFINLIEARRFDLYDDPMPTLNDLEGYLGETSSVLMQLAARILVGEDSFALSDVTGAAGVAGAVAGTDAACCGGVVCPSPWSCSPHPTNRSPTTRHSVSGLRIG